MSVSLNRNRKFQFRLNQDKLAVHPECAGHSGDLNFHNRLTKKRELSRIVVAPVGFS